MEIYEAALRLFIVFPLVIIVTYFGLRFFLRRFAPAFGLGRRVQVLERSALNSRTFLYVVKVGDDYLLVGTTGNTVVLLKDLGPNWGENYYKENESSGNYPHEGLPSFASLLERVGGKRPGAWKFSLHERWLKKLSIYSKKRNKMKHQKEEFVNLTRNYKLRKVKEED